MNMRRFTGDLARGRFAGQGKSASPRRGFSLRLSMVGLVAALGLVAAFIGSPVAVMATSVNRLAICNLEGRAGETIGTEVTLESTDPGERTGQWSTHYKSMPGDDGKMDITSWISFEPGSDFTLAAGETKSFVVRVNIPKNAQPGLWGATSESAGEAGKSDERRTYIIFKDTDTGGSIYSGLLIPVSIKVIGQANPMTTVVSWVKANILVSILILAVIVLLSVLANKRRRARASA